MTISLFWSRLIEVRVMERMRCTGNLSKICWRPTSMLDMAYSKEITGDSDANGIILADLQQKSRQAITDWSYTRVSRLSQTLQNKHTLNNFIVHDSSSFTNFFNSCIQSDKRFHSISLVVVALLPFLDQIPLNIR